VRTRIYVASPLFTEAERASNEDLCRHLEGCFEVFLPQRDGAVLADGRKRGTDVAALMDAIYEVDCQAIRRCDVVVAVVDGPSVDDGVAFELGFAAALGKRCVGVTTDSRREAGYFRNPMWFGSLEVLVHGGDAVLAYMRQEFTPAVVR
jgi:nucleoside 2-deoxyribosyltransferase